MESTHYGVIAKNIPKFDKGGSGEVHLPMSDFGQKVSASEQYGIVLKTHTVLGKRNHPSGAQTGGFLRMF
jgi:hypothetical protein